MPSADPLERAKDRITDPSPVEVLREPEKKTVRAPSHPPKARNRAKAEFFARVAQVRARGQKG